MDRNDLNHGRTAGPRETGLARVCATPFPNPQNARNGKIARLPLAVRTELNQRLRNGETGADILRRLNGLPGVKQVMRDHFAGAELNDANLSRWRDGAMKTGWRKSAPGRRPSAWPIERRPSKGSRWMP